MKTNPFIRQAALAALAAPFLRRTGLACAALLLAFVFWAGQSASAGTIAELAQLPPDTPATIDQAVILSSTNLEADPLYRSFQLRDATRAITVFGTVAQVEAALAGRAVGDEVEISGVTRRRGGTTILGGTVGGFAVTGRTSTHPIPIFPVTALEMDLTGTAAATLESQLVCLHRVQFTDTGVFAVGDYPLAGGAVVVRIASENLGLAGLPIPTGPVNITGILLEYDEGGGSPGGYRLVPRSPADLEAPGFTIAELAQLPPDTPATIDQAVILSTTNLEADPLYRSFQLRDATRAITVLGTVAQVEAVLAGRAVGDEVEISGVTGQRGGTTFLGGSVGGFAVSGRTSSHPFPIFPVAALEVDVTGTAAETLESQLVVLHRVQFTDTGVFAVGDYPLAGGAVVVRIASANLGLAGLPIPTGPVNITGILLQYDEGGGGGGSYRLVPRSPADLEAPGFTIAELAQLPPGTPATIDQAVILSTANLEADPLYRSFQLRDATRAITVLGTVAQVEAALADRAVGDEVRISGVTGSRGGATFLGGSVSGFAVTGRTSTHPLPTFPVTALELDLTGTAAATLESQLVCLHRVQFTDTGVFAVGDYPLAGGAAVVRIASANLGLAGLPIPTGPVNITGILLEYNEGGGGPGGYRLVPRSPADLEAPGFTIAELAQLPPDTPATINQAVILSTINLEADPLYRSFQLRDATRAITVFGTVAQVEAVLAGRAVGDEIQISGVTGRRGGTTILGGAVGGFAVSGRNNTHPFPIFPVTALEMDVAGTEAETLESQLVCLHRVQFTDTGVFAVGDYPLAGGSTVVRIASANLGLVGLPIPTGPVNITGILLEYNEGGGGPGGYRLVPRSPADLEAPGFTIAELAQLPPGTPATIDQAVILSTTNLEADPLYRSFQLRDATRAITVLGTVAQVEAVLAGRAVGDEVRISGVTGQRGGTTILGGTVGGFAVSGRTSTHPLPIFPVAALEVDVTGTAAETLESQLVCLRGVRFADTGVFSLGGDYALTGGLVIVRIATADFELAGTPIPTGPVDITGIVLHYDDGGTGTSGYRLVPRSLADIVLAQTPEVPLLTITRVNDTVVLSWPGPAEGWLLERTADLTGPWTPMPPPYPTTGGVISVPFTITPAVRNQFFRLHQP